MNAPLPFGFPAPTAFYLALYVLTLVVHVAFMNYVLAGTIWLAVNWRARPLPGTLRATDVLRDWMPAMLSGAITAGVAPLLFVQILYKPNFYTANLLLFHRWMSILPVLIVGFYGLYLLKTQWLDRRGPALRMAASLLPAACVAYVGYAWTENHLLSVRTQQTWADFYATGRMVWFEPAIVPRLLMWGAGGVPTMLLVVAWQLRWKQTPQRAMDATFARRAGALAVLALLVAAASAALYLALAPLEARRAVTGAMAWPYLLAAAGGAALQGWAWWGMARVGAPRKGLLLAASGGCATTLAAMTCVREAMRLGTLGETRIADLLPQHAEAAEVGGLVAFLVFAAVNALAVGLCFRVVRRGAAGPVASGGLSPASGG